jgi:molybdopterin-guanine dinucleotide biosynthesis protein A
MQRLTGVDPSQRQAGGDRPESGAAAIVLAGDRQRPDAVATAADTPCKAMAPVAGRPMVERVSDALWASGWIDQALLCGPPREMLSASPTIERSLSDGWLAWLPEASSPAAGALAGLDTLNRPRSVLVTTGDHALLTPEMVSGFMAQATRQPWDAAVAVVPRQLITACYADAHPTATRLRDGPICSCNLFALLSPRGRALVERWRHVEQHRKHPIRTVAAAVGIRSLRDYMMGRLTLSMALERLSQRLGVTVGAVVLPYAAAGLDVDTVADWRLASTIAEGRPSA